MPTAAPHTPHISVPPEVLALDAGLGPWCLIHAWRGSIAHGMYEPSDDPGSIDDLDTMAFCVPPADHYLGLAEYGSRGTREIKHGEWDIVIYEARKAIRLLARGNPNVLSLLWLPEHRYIRRTQAGRALIANRDAFAGRHVYDAFVGYAHAQLDKMTRGAFRGYMGEKRRALVERHGYDTKNAAHLLRLLRTGIEFLGTGAMTVDRGRLDAGELLDVKHGEWTLERVKAEADVLFDRARSARDTSPLPPGPDLERVSELCVGVVRRRLFDRGEIGL